MALDRFLEFSASNKLFAQKYGLYMPTDVGLMMKSDEKVIRIASSLALVDAAYGLLRDVGFWIDIELHYDITERGCRTRTLRRPKRWMMLCCYGRIS